MFNLLPQKEKNEVAKEYRLRFAVISLILFGCLGGLALIALIPSYFLSYQKESAVRKLDEVLKREIALGSKDELSGVVKLAEKEAKAVKALQPATYVYELIDDVVRNKSSKIKVTGLRIVRNEDETRDLAVTGKAENRDALLSFVRTLEREKSFSLVTVPVSNFADAENINFSILVKAK